jgi:hypothetical protein
MFYLGGGIVIFVLLAFLVIYVGMQRMNRPKCPECGLSVDRDLDHCPYCHASMRG